MPLGPGAPAVQVVAASAWMERGFRGTSHAYKVTDEQLEELRSRALRAETLLRKAEELEPGYALAPGELIRVLAHAGAPEREVMAAFERAVTADPEWAPAYTAMYWYLLPQWFGSAEQLLRFARAVRDAHPTNPQLVGLVGSAHLALRRYTKNEQYFRDPVAWPETRDAFLSYLSIKPMEVDVWGRVARLAMEAKDDVTLWYAFQRYSQLEPEPGHLVDGERMNAVRKAASAAQSRVLRLENHAPDLERLRIGPGGRPVARAVLLALGVAHQQ